MRHALGLSRLPVRRLLGGGQITEALQIYLYFSMACAEPCIPSLPPHPLAYLQIHPPSMSITSLLGPSRLGCTLSIPCNAAALQGAKARGGRRDIQTVEIDGKYSTVGCIAVEFHQDLIGGALGGFLCRVPSEHAQLWGCLLWPIPKKCKSEMEDCDDKTLLFLLFQIETSPLHADTFTPHPLVLALFSSPWP